MRDGEKYVNDFKDINYLAKLGLDYRRVIRREIAVFLYQFKSLIFYLLERKDYELGANDTARNVAASSSTGRVNRSFVEAGLTVSR